MTRVFIYEYACAQADAVGLPASVRTEGQAMLKALVEDFARGPCVEVLTLQREQPGVEERSFKRLAAAADWSLVIAPEFDHLLVSRCQWVGDAGGRLLGPSVDAVRVAGDKWLTYRLLERHGVPTPRTWLAEESAESPRQPGLLVRKPRWGAGSQEVSLIQPGEAVEYQPGFLLQEFVSGIAASVAFLMGPTTVVPLLPAYQRLSADGHFHYLGGCIPLDQALRARANDLAKRAVAVVAGLRGYVGVDLVLGEANDGSLDRVIEINPRLTTSYVGLRQLATANLAELLLQIATGEAISPLHWRSNRVVFAADGNVVRSEETCSS